MPNIQLRPWSESDFPLLVRGNAAAMTEHLGGPESDAEVRDRHERYLRLWREGGARMFTIVHDGVALGGIGWWATTWHDQEVFETGWFVVPEGQGQGVAAAAVRLTIDDVREHGERRLLTAFPSVANPASNRLCERAGFTLSGVEDFPFRGIVLHVNAWTLDLAAPAAQPNAAG